MRQRKTYSRTTEEEPGRGARQKSWPEIGDDFRGYLVGPTSTVSASGVAATWLPQIA